MWIEKKREEKQKLNKCVIIYGCFGAVCRNASAIQFLLGENQKLVRGSCDLC